jgi:N,N'-diacetyllegionaminate synthase
MKSTIIIAEAGVNHNGVIENALKLVEEAAEAGADFVKFQTFKSEALVSRNAKKAQYQMSDVSSANDSQFEMLKKLELSKSDHEIILEHCEKNNIKFFSTAFDLESFKNFDEI